MTLGGCQWTIADNCCRKSSKPTVGVHNGQCQRRPAPRPRGRSRPRSPMLSRDVGRRGRGPRREGPNRCRCRRRARPVLKLHEPRKLKVLFSNIHAKTRKLWKLPAIRLVASRTNAAHQSTNRPLMNSVCPPRCPLHSSGLTCMRTCTSRRAGVPPIIKTAANIRSP
jgi:hypothetical protein